MKKNICILMILVAAFLCGCGQADTEFDADVVNVTEVYDAFSDTAGLYITVDREPGEDYMMAEITAEWGSNKSVAPAEIKLRGNSSKESEKKAYTIKYEEEISLMGMDAGRKWALVSNPFDKSLLRPAVGFAYAHMLDLEYTSDIRLCNVWLNDRYMGVYTAMEPVEAGDGKVEIDPDDGDFLLERNMGRYEEDQCYIDSPSGIRFEFNEPEGPSDQQVRQCYALLAAAEDAIFSGNHSEYEKYIDVDSFVDFYIFNEMIKDIDFGEYSTRYYFKDGIMYAGPPWDLDLTQGNVSADKEEFKYSEYNNIDNTGDESCDSARGMWAACGDYYYWLCRDPWFRELAAYRWKTVRSFTENLAVANELGESVLDRYVEGHKDSLEANFTEAGWSVNEPENPAELQYPADTYLGNVEMLRNWLIRRADYLDTQLISENFVNFR